MEHVTGQLSVTMVMQVVIPPTVSALVSTTLSLISLSLLLLLCVIRKKRRMEGTYRPSAEERKQTGAAGPEKPGLPLPLPKEERLI
uniref:protein crumbs homolog 3b n=1 Tax=Monopterus albus TaxID=43700 RepID=UPI0009B35548|nr:protein crumbs homolog 3-like [Monopterus albus]